MDSFQVRPIGHIQSPFKEKFGTPRQPGLANEIEATITFVTPYNDINAFEGLDGFDYIWLIFVFHEAMTTEFSPRVRPPRLGGNQKRGVFATRSPFRPNSIGISLVKLKEVKTYQEKVELVICGHDLIDQTPILDIKPYIPATESFPSARAGWTEYVHKNECLPVDISDSLKSSMDSHLLVQVVAYLKLDPRPSYQDDERIYKNKFDQWDVVWKVEQGRVKILDLEKL